jgi:hypothetical protein
VRRTEHGLDVQGRRPDEIRRSAEEGTRSADLLESINTASFPTVSLTSATSLQETARILTKAFMHGRSTTPFGCLR